VVTVSGFELSAHTNGHMNVTPNASILAVEDNPDLNYALCELFGSYGLSGAFGAKRFRSA